MTTVPVTDEVVVAVVAVPVVVVPVDDPLLVVLVAAPIENEPEVA